MLTNGEIIKVINYWHLENCQVNVKNEFCDKHEVAAPVRYVGEHKVAAPVSALP